MGFEPFIPPKKVQEKSPEIRHDKVHALAQLLHSRGLTSSMADARRLAEGMVDVEKKVIKQETKMQTHLQEKPQPTHTVKNTHLTLPEDFLQFVAKAAALSHEVHTTEPPAQAPPIEYGREEKHVIAEVPHVHKQIFFAEAPAPTEIREPPKQSMTEVITGDAGVQVTKVESTPQVEVVEETTIVTVPETKESKKEDLAKQHGIDIFEIFKKK